MGTGAKALSWLRNVVAGVFAAALLAGILLPVYSDEVGWRLQERAALDGFDKLFTDFCGPNTLARPPFWMMPARYYSALFNTLFADPLYIRLSGILYALVWTGLLLLLVRRVADAAQERVALSTTAIGFLSLGTMPLLMVISRPEQPIMIAFTAALLIALADWREVAADTPAAKAWIRSLVIAMLALVAMSYHVKGVATVPLFLVCLALASRGRASLLPRLLCAALLVAAGVWAAQYWIHRFECPGDARVSAVVLRSTGAALVAASDASQIAPLLAKALGNVSVLLYPGTPAPRFDPMAFWLPAGRISADDSFVWFLVMISAWAFALIAVAWCLLHAARRSWKERRLDSRAVLSVALLATGIGWSATGFTGIYEATFTLPMLVIAVVLALSTQNAGTRFAGGLAWGGAIIGLMGLVSVPLVARIYGPSLAAAAQERGYIKDQPLSISAFGYGGLHQEILSAARQCGIVDPPARRAVMIDDVTYFAFMQSRRPQHTFGLFSPLVKIDDPIGYLRGIGSDGLITTCRSLPPGIQARARRQGQFCCLAPPGW
jgi:hypothetical protein